MHQLFFWYQKVLQNSWLKNLLVNDYLHDDIKGSVLTTNSILIVDCREDGWLYEPLNGRYALCVRCCRRECEWDTEIIPGSVSDETDSRSENIRVFASAPVWNGILCRDQAGREKSIRMPQLEEEILHRMEDQLGCSTWAVPKSYSEGTGIVTGGLSATRRFRTLVPS